MKRWTRAASGFAPTWDSSPGGIAWSRDGKTLYAHADELGQHPLFAFDVASGAVKKVVAIGQLDGFAVGSSALLYGVNTLTSPSDLFAAKLDGSSAKQISRVNAEALSKVRFGEPEQTSRTAALGRLSGIGAKRPWIARQRVRVTPKSPLRASGPPPNRCLLDRRLPDRLTDKSASTS